MALSMLPRALLLVKPWQQASTPLLHSQDQTPAVLLAVLLAKTVLPALIGLIGRAPFCTGCIYAG